VARDGHRGYGGCMQSVGGLSKGKALGLTVTLLGATVGTACGTDRHFACKTAECAEAGAGNTETGGSAGHGGKTNAGGASGTSGNGGGTSPNGGSSLGGDTSSGGTSPAGGTTSSGGDTSSGGTGGKGGSGGTTGGSGGSNSKGGDTGTGPGGEGGASGATDVTGGSAGTGGGNTPPSVVSVTPTNNTTGVQPDGTVQIKFSEALTSSTVTTSTVTVSLNGSAIGGTVSYSGTTATFTPSARLTLLGSYAVKVSHTVQDLQGANMAADFASTFTVRDGAWDTPYTVSACANAFMSAAADGNGNVLVACSNTSATGTKAVYAAWYHPSRAGTAAAWENPATIEACTNCYGPHVAVNASGTAVVGYWNASAATYAYKTRQYRNGAWESASQTMVSGVSDAGDHTLGVDPAGNAHVAIFGDDTLTTRNSNTSGTWDSAATDQFAQVASGSTLTMAFVPNGNGLLAWTTYGDSSGNYHMRTTRYSSTSKAWTQDTDIANITEPGGGAIGPPAIAVDSSGNAMLTGTYIDPTSTGGVYASRFTAASGWSDGAAIDNLDYQYQDEGVPTALAFDGTDFVAAWLQPTVQGGSLLNAYSNRWDNGAWATQQLRSDGSTAVNPNGAGITADSDGHSLMVWTSQIGQTADNDALFSRYANGSWSDPAHVFTQPSHWGARLVGSPNGVAAFNTSVPVTGGDAFTTVIFE